MDPKKLISPHYVVYWQPSQNHVRFRAKRFLIRIKEKNLTSLQDLSGFVI